ncbi:hypothetical protein [Streptomyces qaidamensis]|uniref:hypothetical protein n=1 Tax=Streptomyces qaidamensis TaxID=1783515 RepID=UPI00131DF12C|nr:hypothetical protein [Streptomyces qaidamensis]
MRVRPAPVLAGVDGSAARLAAAEWGAGRPPGPHPGPVTHVVVHHVGRPVAVVPHE